MNISVCRVAHFNAAHRLYNKNWSFEKNESVFGKCNNPNFHGHNYKLEVWVTGPIDPETGYVIDLGELKAIIKTEVEDRFDHKNLNEDTVEFKHLNPTAENISMVIYEILKNAIPQHLALRVRLYETERNVVECNGD
ncbi:MAG: 6-carboxytetrahydropterin synthase [Putridiphycobacter sp.]|nr:6-carboxytetrahydropterin synthase [Putridiphycobacter sp.]